MASNLEFKRGYAFADSDQILALLAGFKHGIVGKDELRIFAARLELGAQPAGSKVSLPTVLKQQDGKGLGPARRKQAENNLQLVLAATLENPKPFRIKISRPVIRAIAKGKTKGGGGFSPGLMLSLIHI